LRRHSHWLLEAMREPLRGVNGSGSFGFTTRLGLAGRVGQLPGFDGVVVLVDLVIIDVVSKVYYLS
jgi:hypothetical protein